jgi:hypothetical protein
VLPARLAPASALGVHMQATAVGHTGQNQTSHSPKVIQSVAAVLLWQMLQCPQIPATDPIPFGLSDPNESLLPAHCMRALLYPRQPVPAHGQRAFRRRCTSPTLPLRRRSGLLLHTRTDRLPRTPKRHTTIAIPRVRKHRSRRVQGACSVAARLPVGRRMLTKGTGRPFHHELDGLRMTVAACQIRS